ncbi:pilus assembly protein PilM [Janthinobacterium sp. EB271-G4-7A]|uniref:pilus assembly protein PilM n=1 Tax=Janthinobacterium sp. EB271-G4-7A TaxID=2775056 RepID=UPI001E36A03D|nr:pilus assembly protein PilM [Janthinobacterium sp. EB271-G4-7A]MCC7700024.1 pilus assembly protein PilM [Janthinobacterium sp. EB271-G4-7A]
MPISNFLGTSLLGVDIADDAVRVVELRRRRGKLSCRHCGAATLAPGVILEGNVEDMLGLADALRHAHRDSGSACTRVALAMPATALITHAIRLPAGLAEEQLEILVELEAAQYMPFALEDASLDFFILGPAPPLPGTAGKEVDVLLVAARRASVQRRLDAARAAGLLAVVMDSEALALQAALAQGGWQALPDGGVAYQLAWGLALHRYAR